MSFKRLSKIAHGLRGFEIVAAQILVLFLLIVMGSEGNDSAIPPMVGFTETDKADYAAKRSGPADWRNISIYEAPVPDRTAWLDWEIPDEALNRPAPLAISMHGPFSAEVYFNGAEIGKKGVPGVNARSETAGPIDAVFAIPEHLILPAGNRLAIRYSANRAGYQPATVVQSLYVAPYRADARRDLRYYAPALLFSGGLIAAAAGMVLLARTRKDRRLYWLVLGIFALTISIAAEVSRSLINYPYDWHQTRQAIVGAGFVLFGMTQLRFVTLRWPAPKRWDVVLLALGFVLAILAWVFSAGYDAKTTVATAAIFILIVTWTLWRGLRADRTALVFGLSLLGFPLLALASPGDFLDRSIYILAVSFFGFALLRSSELLSPKSVPAPEKTMFSVQSGGRTVFVPIDEIVMLKAAGNYTEVHRGGERWELDNRGLSAITAELPKVFFRVHRSYAVNLSAAESLTSQEGSRYWLALRTGERLPVSRNRVAELRTAMDGIVVEGSIPVAS